MKQAHVRFDATKATIVPQHVARAALIRGSVKPQTNRQYDSRLRVLSKYLAFIRGGEDPDVVGCTEDEFVMFLFNWMSQGGGNAEGFRSAVLARHRQELVGSSFLMKAEIENAHKVLTNGKKPFTAIIGGAKVSDKILIVENLLSIADHIIIGGGMAYTFIKALGGNIGNSICEVERIPTCLAIIEKAKLNGVEIHLPLDSVIADEFSPTAKVTNCLSNQIPDGWMGLDIGEKSCLEFEKVLSKSMTILWNGPMGVFEMEPFSEGTKSIASAVASATNNGTFSLIGGGDSAAAILKFGFEDEVSYISTGGGALLEYFEGKELPGVIAIQN